MARLTLHPFRLALRSLGRTPFFTATAVISLAIGIGANTTIFTAANGLLLAPLPGVPDSQRLVDIGRRIGSTGFDTVSYPTYVDLTDQTRDVFAGVYATQIELQPMSLGAADGAERIYTQLVSASYFDVLGIAPATGTVFHTAEAQVGVPLRKIVLSHAFWRRRFDADPSVAGREIRLNGDAYLVAGIAPAGFSGTTILSPDAWIPLTAHGRSTPSTALITGRENLWLMMGARLAPGVSVEQAAQATAAVGERLQAAYPDIYRDRGLVAVPASRVPGEPGAFLVPFLAILMGLVGLIQFVACTNLAGLLLTRTAARSREIAVRLALGASRRAVVALLLTETLLLFTAGAAAAVLVSRWTTAALGSVLGRLPFPVAVDLSLDWRILAFTAGLAGLTGLVTGLVPALQATRPSIAGDLKSDAQAPRRRRLRHAFVVLQIAACFVLVVLAGLFLHALGRAGDVDTGMRIDGVDVASASLDLSGRPDSQWAALADELRDGLRALPAVAEAGAGRVMPLQDSSMGLGDLRKRGDASDAGRVRADWNVITPGYLEVIGVPIVRGRAFGERDRAGAPGVAIVNERLAAEAWPGQDPIGQMLEYGDFRPGRENVRTVTVVGVAREAKYRSIGESPVGFIFVPLAQYPMQDVHFFLRRAGPAPVTEAAVRGVFQSVDRNLPVVGFSTFRQQADIGLLPQRIASATAGALGVVALILAAIGIYGVTAFAVASRTREIGVRVALGADPARIRRLVVGQGVRLTAIGATLGLLAALGLSQLVRSLLFGVSPADPLAFGTTALAVAAVSVAAGLHPARRAARLDPVRALRAD